MNLLCLMVVFINSVILILDIVLGNSMCDSSATCKPVTECAFYKNLLDNRIPGLRKDAVIKELQKQGCGWDGDDFEKPKGKYYIINIGPQSL